MNKIQPMIDKLAKLAPELQIKIEVGTGSARKTRIFAASDSAALCAFLSGRLGKEAIRVSKFD